jgi:tetraacyldisaccharide 4'-kinase
VTPPVRILSTFFRMQTRVDEAVSLSDPSQSIPLPALAAMQKAGGMRLLALCAIGAPERFFAMLRAHGLAFEARALPDHEAIEAHRLQGGAWDRILVTEKDAVKCAGDTQLARDPRLWVVPLHATIDPALVDFVDARLQGVSHGSATA